MKKYFFLFFLCLFANANCLAENITLELEKAPVNINDVESIKRGAKFFSSVCMACHTLIYMRYDKLAQEQGVIYSKMPINVKSWPFGVKPPDLSLEASVRGVDWIYTYLHSFYVDTGRPTGFNNILVPNSSMMDILAPFQGKQIRDPNLTVNAGIYDHKLRWYDVVELQSQGAYSPEKFDALVTDIVNFLAYSAEPYKAQQNSLGYWVIAFLLVLLVLVYLLKKEYWKDVYKKMKE